MNESRTLTIELSPDDWQLLEAEALKVNHPPEILIKTLVEPRRGFVYITSWLPT